MNKTKDRGPSKPAAASKSRTTEADWAGASSWSRTVRETVESIVIAFILAFLFRTFEVEAFVIPTGSMAPTLKGRHLDLACPECKYHFQVGAKHEEQDESKDVASGRDLDIGTCICPNCGYTLNFSPHSLGRLISVDPQQLIVTDNAGKQLSYDVSRDLAVLVGGRPGKLDDLKPGDEIGYLRDSGVVLKIFKSPATDPAEKFYNGDRILVSKFAFDFTPPKRWDVIVFKYPEDAKTNYIKRLIGLPNEVIRIRDGDIAISKDGGKTFASAERSPEKLQAMLQVVYDNDYVFAPLLAYGWPARWHDGNDSPQAAWSHAKTSAGDDDPKVFVSGDKAQPTAENGIHWLRYTNYVPQGQDWDRFERNEPLTKATFPTPRPIGDFVAYDASNGEPSRLNDVEDLAVECTVDVASASGKLVLECVKQGAAYRCAFDLAAGTAELMIPGRAAAERPVAREGCIAGAGSYRVELANVDHQLTVWVNGTPVKFDHSTLYDLNTPPVRPDAASDGSAATPVAIGSQGAALRVSHLRVLRDVYYTYIDMHSESDHPFYERQSVPPSWPDGTQWICFPAAKYQQLSEAGADVRAHDQYFFSGSDQFFPMGDNSPLSQDGRLWLNIHFVDRRLMIGKAIYIFWPHSFDHVSIFGHEIPFPFFPNFARMGFVR